MPNYIIGVDVGGTNTDSVLLDSDSLEGPTQGILAWKKTQTTDDVSIGIVAAIEALFQIRTDVKPKDISSVTIGTTHFINAVIEQDSNRLARVAVLRLCGPYSQANPPCCDFPPALVDLIDPYVAYLDGGFKIDGVLVKELNKKQILYHVDRIKALGITSIVINGNFSPLNNAQELEAKLIVQEALPSADIVMSHESKFCYSCIMFSTANIIIKLPTWAF